MRPLVAVRRAAPFNPHVFERGGLFAPLARAARPFAAYGDFPPVADLGKVFKGAPPVRFVAATPRRRRGEPVDPSQLYDAQITRAATVPARERCWHDFMNALVWGTFPNAKRSLHARQHRAISAGLTPSSRTLPPFRTRELDALALLDEGGVVVLAPDPDALRARLKPSRGSELPAAMASGAARVVVFGHAIYESLALGVRPAVVAAVVVADPLTGVDVAAAVDAALSNALEDPTQFRSPDELTRLDLSQLGSAEAAPR